MSHRCTTSVLSRDKRSFIWVDGRFIRGEKDRTNLELEIERVGIWMNLGDKMLVVMNVGLCTVYILMLTCIKQVCRVTVECPFNC